MSRVTRAVTIDIETGIVLERISESYDGPWALCKESDAQKNAQAQQNAFNAQLLSIYKTQFGESQAILSVLTPQLEGMAANPQGFGVDEYHALQAQIVNDVGAQFSSAAKQNALEFATTNEAGLPSGVELSVDAATRAAAAGTVASESTSLAVANEQLKQQQQQFAISGLNAEAGLVGQENTATGSQVGSGLQNQFQNATTIYNQGQQWKNILAGVASSAIGVGTSFLTGGLSSIASGGGFLEGGGAAIGSGAH
jgi:hypothetical protein